MGPNFKGATAHPPSTKPQMNTENQATLVPTSQNTPPPLEDAPVCTGTPWPKAGKMLGNLFKIMKDWLILLDSNDAYNTATAADPKTPIKLEPQNQETQKIEECGWGQDCPFCKKVKEEWSGNHQDKFQQKNMQQKPTIPQTSQPTQAQPFNISDRYMEQIHLRKEWEKKMERLNEKYNLNCFSSSELDSESDEGENYRFQHHYETLI